jgi:hypothetical protein
VPLSRGQRLALSTENDTFVPRCDEGMKGRKDDAQKQCDSRTIKCELLLVEMKIRSPKYMH